MESPRELLDQKSVSGRGNVYHVTLHREDFTSLYPGMYRYVLEAAGPGRAPAVFVTNTYEYSPLLAGSAESAARQTMDVWEQDLKRDADIVFSEYAKLGSVRPVNMSSDLVVLQGSPRPDGNCAILSQWAVEAAHDAGKTTVVIYPHDLDIHPCIGCYQCYNSGTCVFRDDMDGIIEAVRGATLVIVCSPVYTNTVPAGLKLVIDRMQAYHAERALFGGRAGRNGLMYAVAGRKGAENFTCITRVLSAFFHTLGVEPAGQVLIDNADTVHDIRKVAGKEEAVKEQVKMLLSA